MAPKISDEELKEIEAKDRHDELINAVKTISTTDPGVEKRHEEMIGVLQSLESGIVPEIDRIMSQMSKDIVGLEQKRSEDMAQAAAKISTGIDEIKTILKARPKGFTIVRNRFGLIERVVPEY
jgi:hypothetical protein